MGKNTTPPTSHAEAESEYEDLLGLMQDIQTQLGSKNRCTPEGERLSWSDYDDWRSRAKTKLRITTDRMRLIKKWMKDNDPRQRNEKEELKDALSEYGIHIDDCGWWNSKRCSCGLDKLLDKYGLDKLEAEDVDEATGTDTEAVGAAG